MDKHLLLEAKEEIITLRKTNQILSAQMEVVNIFAVALGIKYPQSGMSPDVAWKLDKAILKIEEEEKLAIETLKAEMQSRIPEQFISKGMGAEIKREQTHIDHAHTD